MGFIVFMVKADKAKYSFVTKKDGVRVTPSWLRHSFGIWNLLLSLFSCYGMVRTVPALLHFIATKSFRETLCDQPTLTYGHGGTGLAVQLFILSKVPELFDTLFLALKGVEINL